MAALASFPGLEDVGWAQTPSPALPAGVDQVVKLSQAKMSEDIILTYIRSSNLSCALSADQILYLNGQGVPQSAITALMQNSSPAAPPAASAPAPVSTPAVVTPPAPSPVPVPSTPAPVAPAPIVVPGAPTTVVAAPTTTIDTFRAQLASYGTWMQVDGYGLCWRPAELVAFPAWRPYCDRGHWVYTADGWYWQSDYPWGDIVFHYGRWVRDVRFGWLWIPDTTWGPAWVCWRQTDAYCGWAPLPPAARFQAGIGWSFNGRVGIDLDFGLREDHFVFVSYDRFWETNFRLYLLPRERVHVFFGASRVMNHYRMVNNHFIFEGIGPDRIGRYSHHRVRVEVVPHGRFEEHRVIVDRHDSRPNDRDHRDDHKDDRRDHH